MRVEPPFSDHPEDSQVLFQIKLPQQGLLERRFVLADLSDAAAVTARHYTTAAEALGDDPQAMWACLRAGLAAWPEDLRIRWLAMRTVLGMAEPGQELLQEAVDWSEVVVGTWSSPRVLDVRAQLQWAAGQHAEAAVTARQILDQLPEEDRQRPWMRPIYQRATQYSAAAEAGDPEP